MLPGYVEVKDIETIQKLLYQLMYKLHGICEENNIKYVLFGGSMLGAVRHKGMIPWDDDIDICVSRPDYNKLKSVVNNGNYNDYLFRSYPEDGYAYPFGKFCLKDSILIEKGIDKKYARGYLFIDVFPVDGYPDDEHEKEHFNKIRMYKQKRYYCIRTIKVSNTIWKKPFVLIKMIQKAILNVTGYKVFIKKEINELEKYNYNTSKTILMQGSGWNEKGKLEKLIFERRKLFEFGIGYAYGIEDYDAHLTKLYGDYMTPPPIDKRKSNHSYELYVKKEVLEGLGNERQ